MARRIRTRESNQDGLGAGSERRHQADPHSGKLPCRSTAICLAAPCSLHPAPIRPRWSDVLFDLNPSAPSILIVPEVQVGSAADEVLVDATAELHAEEMVL